MTLSAAIEKACFMKGINEYGYGQCSDKERHLEREWGHTVNVNEVSIKGR